MKLPGNLGDLLQQAQQMQQNFAKVKEELEQREVEATVGGGMVKVRMTGAQLLKDITIDQTVIDAKDREMLQDLVRAAVNEAVRKSQSLMKEELGKLTGGLPIPGLFG